MWTPTHSTPSPARSRTTSSATTTGCSRWTARSATRRCTTRVATSRPQKPVWPSVSSRPPRTSSRQAGNSDDGRFRGRARQFGPGTSIRAGAAVGRGRRPGHNGRMTNANLLGPEPTWLPERPDAESELEDADDPADAAAQYPDFSEAWAALAERALEDGHTMTAYAYARTGYHRGLDQLRKSGWKGFGP